MQLMVTKGWWVRGIGKTVKGTYLQLVRKQFLEI